MKTIEQELKQRSRSAAKKILRADFETFRERAIKLVWGPEPAVMQEPALKCMGEMYETLVSRLAERLAKGMLDELEAKFATQHQD